ncbi:helix-turn-helix transcriptional regulator, partial [Mycobacterium tuberculosis]|nr:helix-turn-helix transcriptional regulator [Mycobacterium tuberculosis]
MSDEATKTPRQRAREETETRIVEIGNRMLDESGVEALSLRAVARELGIVSSAVYRYVKTRDELLTILL